MEVRLVETRGGELALQGKFANTRKWCRARILRRFGGRVKWDDPKLQKRIQTWMKKKGHVPAHPFALNNVVKIDEK